TAQSFIVLNDTNISSLTALYPNPTPPDTTVPSPVSSSTLLLLRTWLLITSPPAAALIRQSSFPTTHHTSFLCFFTPSHSLYSLQYRYAKLAFSSCHSRFLRRPLSSRRA